MKKIETLLLLFGLFMVLQIAESSAQNPVTPQGSGTEQDPYVISSLSNLCWLSINNGDWGKCYIQTSDIGATETNTWNVGDHDLDPDTPDQPMGFLPIGDDPEDGKRQMIPFNGLYNGNDFVILGLYINQPCCDNIGMFGMINNGAQISNLRLENVNITGKNKTGGLVGYVRDSITEISNCYTTGNVKGNRFVGGLAGYNLYGSTIDYCYSSASVNGNTVRIGGLVGYNYGSSIQHCYASGHVSGKEYIGGLVGYNNELSTIKYCNASGPVTATGKGCGGLAGSNINSTITNCYAVGNINGGESAGGLVGEERYLSTVKYSHATGDVYGTGRSLGGLIGYVEYSFIQHCYALGNVSGPKWYFGGLVGQSNGVNISYSYAKGNINPDSENRSYCGGLIGRMQDFSYIYKCFASGNVNNKDHTNNDSDCVGGLAGEVNTNSVVDLSCAKGDVYGYTYLGGLVGKLIGDSRIQNSYAKGETIGYGIAAGLVGENEGGSIIKFCFATGKITVTNNDLTWNGLVADIYGDVVHSYYDRETTGIYNSDPNSGRGESTSEMKKQSTYYHWEFGNYWAIDPDNNDGYPYLIGTPQQIDGQIVWEGTNDSNWSNSENWNFGFVPGMDDDVLIPGTDSNPIISATDRITIKNLTVNNNASLTLESNTENTASLIVTNNASGNVNVERFLVSNKYHFIHIPVNTGQTYMKDITTVEGNLYLGLTPDDDDDVFEKWNENGTITNNLWTDLLHGSPPLMDNVTFDIGHGYGYLNTENKLLGDGNTLVFVGEVITGSVSFNNSYTNAGGEGYHVIGNPFTSTISINNFADAFHNFLNDNGNILHDNYEAVYLWKTNSIMNDGSNDYEIICNCGFTGVGDSSAFGYDFIEPGQGFTVRIEHEGNIIFKPGIRKHANSVFFKSKEKTWPGVQLFAESDSAKTSTKIGFHKYMTKWVDRSYDVGTLKGNTGANIYSRIYNEYEHFAVQSVHTFSDSIICGIDIIRPGEYIFSIYQEQMIKVDLQDIVTGETIDMLNDNTYTVYLPEGNYENRFVLFLETNQYASIEDTPIFKGKIYSYHKSIYVNGIKSLIEIYDINGHLIKSENANGNKRRIVMDEFTGGVYIVKTAYHSQKVMLAF